MFSPQQQKIIGLFGEGQAVVAGAGCGKTTTLVAKCLALVKSHRETGKEARFCAVSFTEKSVRDLKASLAKGFIEDGVPYDSKTHWVKTLHGLCSTILQEFPLQAGLQGGEKIILEDESSRLWERSLNLLWSQNDNQELTEAVGLLLETYSKSTLEGLLQKLRSLMSFGVDELIQKNFDRPEVKALWMVFESVYRRYQHFKMRDGGLDFNDLELKALQALKDPKVGQYYQKRFDLILVDEFQDTNPIQGKILEGFVRPGMTNLCIVGDPKQSIYRFRDADVSVFLDLTKKLPHRHLLDINYRSRPKIIEFVNRVCEPAFLASELDYEPLQPGRDLEAEPFANVTRLVTEDEYVLARFLKAQEQKGVDLSDYVILARSIKRDKTQKFMNAMDTLQVPFILGSGGRFYSDPRVQELVAFLKGWVSPQNTLSQATALRAPWIGITDAKLLEWKDHFFERFFAESDHPVAQSLREAFEKRMPVRPGQILEMLWKIEVLDDEMTLSLVSLWHKAEQLSSQGRRFEEVVQYFVRAIESEKIEKEIPPPAQKGTVRIMTVHASKGLQFPRVILLDFDGVYRSAASKMELIWDRKKGVHLFHRDEDGKKIKDDSVNMAWTEIEKRAIVAESKRLFYVALTRAQEELILVWKPEAKAVEEPFLADSWRAWIEATDLPPEREHEVPTSGERGNDLVSTPQNIQEKRVWNFKPYRPRHSPSEWLVLNQCQLRYQKRYLQSESSEISAKDEKRKEEASLSEPSDLAETVAKKGERVHRWIEIEDWKSLLNEFGDESIGQPIVDRLKKELVASGSTQIYKELGFEVPLGDRQALVGMMDRLEVDAEKRTIRVIDYKWTQAKKTPDALLSHYLLQLQLYAWAASRMVDFSPIRVEARLIHLTRNSLEVVEAPVENFDLSKIKEKIGALFEKSKSVLQLKLESKNSKPEVGEYCSYCEVRSQCPAFERLGAKPH